MKPIILASTPILDRNTASKFNPMIGIHAKETLDHCARAVNDLGYVVSGADEMGLDFDKSNLFRLFETVTIAMRYELSSLQQADQEQKEA